MRLLRLIAYGSVFGVAVAIACGGGDDRDARKGNLTEQLQRFAAASFDIQYAVTAGGESASDIRFAQDERGRKVVSLGTEESLDGTLALYVTDQVIALCTDRPSKSFFFSDLDLEDDEGICRGRRGAEGLEEFRENALAQVGALSDPLGIGSLSDYEVSAPSKKRILDRDTSCFQLDNKAATTVVEVCFDARGALLFKRTDENGFVAVITASTYLDEPLDTTFALPWDLIEA